MTRPRLYRWLGFSSLVFSSLSVIALLWLMPNLNSRILLIRSSLREQLREFDSLESRVREHMSGIRSSVSADSTPRSKRQWGPPFVPQFAPPQAWSETGGWYPAVCQCDQRNFCPPGLPGAPGRPGLDGLMGQPGSPGEQGLPGIVPPIFLMPIPGCRLCPNGPVGPPGVQGVPGPQGLAGFPGDPGVPGAPGIVGPVGSLGPLGQPGEPGSPGQSGPPGASGVMGLKGLPGEKGPQGDPGQAGMPGMPGHEGHAGFPGIDGFPGPEGLRGSPGHPGFGGIGGFPGPPGVDASYCECPGHPPLTPANALIPKTKNSSPAVPVVIAPPPAVPVQSPPPIPVSSPDGSVLPIRPLASFLPQQHPSRQQFTNFPSFPSPHPASSPTWESSGPPPAVPQPSIFPSSPASMNLPVRPPLPTPPSQSFNSVPSPAFPVSNAHPHGPPAPHVKLLEALRRRSSIITRSSTRKYVRVSYN